MNLVVAVPFAVPPSEVRVELVAGTENPMWDDVWDPALKAFAFVCSAGGFGGDARRDRHTLQFEAMGGAARRYVIRPQFAQVGAWRVLANMCLARGASSVPLRSITIAATDAAPLDKMIVSSTELAAVRYPQRPLVLPFECDIEPSVYSSGAISMRLGLAHPAQAFEIAQLSCALANWLEVANGGYPDDDMMPVDCVVDATELYELTRSTLEMRLPIFCASYAAWDAVVNMLCRYDSTGSQIRSFSVTP